TSDWRVFRPERVGLLPAACRSVTGAKGISHQGSGAVSQTLRFGHSKGQVAGWLRLEFSLGYCSSGPPPSPQDYNVAQCPSSLERGLTAIRSWSHWVRAGWARYIAPRIRDFIDRSRSRSSAAIRTPGPN